MRLLIFSLLLALTACNNDGIRTRLNERNIKIVQTVDEMNGISYDLSDFASLFNNCIDCYAEPRPCDCTSSVPDMPCQHRMQESVRLGDYLITVACFWNDQQFHKTNGWYAPDFTRAFIAYGTGDVWDTFNATFTAKNVETYWPYNVFTTVLDHGPMQVYEMKRINADLHPDWMHWDGSALAKCRRTYFYNIIDLRENAGTTASFGVAYQWEKYTPAGDCPTLICADTLLATNWHNGDEWPEACADIPGVMFYGGRMTWNAPGSAWIVPVYNDADTFVAYRYLEPYEIEGFPEYTGENWYYKDGDPTTNVLRPKVRWGLTWDEYLAKPGHQPYRDIFGAIRPTINALDRGGDRPWIIPEYDE